MARIQIDFPSQALYSQRLRVRITDINAANHLGFDNMVGILNDVAAGFLTLTAFHGSCRAVVV